MYLENCSSLIPRPHTFPYSAWPRNQANVVPLSKASCYQDSWCACDHANSLHHRADARRGDKILSIQFPLHIFPVVYALRYTFYILSFLYLVTSCWQSSPLSPVAG